MRIDNIRILDLHESVRASKYPKAVDTTMCESNITETVKKLAQSPRGSGHDQFLTGIVVNFDLTCSNKMWIELQRYHFIEFVSSQSTMHRIAHFDLEKQCNEWVDKDIINKLKEFQTAYKENPSIDNFCKLIYNVPSGFNLTARLTTNYRALKTIYAQRKNHKLPEWHIFCMFIESLPYAEELILGGKKELLKETEVKNG